MIIPLFNVEAMAEQAYQEEPDGVDRVSFLLGFVAGMKAMREFWTNRLEHG